MRNQDKLFDLWVQQDLPTCGVHLGQIGDFAEGEKGNLRSKKGTISLSGLNYAVLKFILEYCYPLNWPPGLWEDFEKATHPKKGNYSVWRKHPHLSVDIVGKCPSGLHEVHTPCRFTTEGDNAEFSISLFLSNEGVSNFIDSIIARVNEERISGRRGWLEHLAAYEWRQGRPSLREGIEIRRHFNHLVNGALPSQGRGSHLFKWGIANAIAGWGGLPEVSKEDAQRVFGTIAFLKGAINQDSIDCARIFARRIALASKVYYFSDPLNWTIYDSRLAFALSQFSYLFSKDAPIAFHGTKEIISFPIPPSQSSQREHPFGVKWDNSHASLWFLRASVLLRAIATQLNKRGFTSPPETLSPMHSWELYHVEMVFFTLGKQSWQ